MGVSEAIVLERRRLVLKDLSDGNNDPKYLTQKYNVSEKTIQRDIKYIRAKNSEWINKIMDFEFLHLYRETLEGIQGDINKLEELRKIEYMKPFEKQVQAMIIKSQSELREKKLDILAAGPVVWIFDMLTKKNLLKPTQRPEIPVLKNTHISLDNQNAQIPQDIK